MLILDFGGNVNFLHDVKSHNLQTHAVEITHVWSVDAFGLAKLLEKSHCFSEDLEAKGSRQWQGNLFKSQSTFETLDWIKRLFTACVWSVSQVWSAALFGAKKKVNIGSKNLKLDKWHQCFLNLQDALHPNLRLQKWEESSKERIVVMIHYFGDLLVFVDLGVSAKNCIDVRLQVVRLQIARAELHDSVRCSWKVQGKVLVDATHQNWERNVVALVLRRWELMQLESGDLRHLWFVVFGGHMVLNQVVRVWQTLAEVLLKTPLPLFFLLVVHPGFLRLLCWGSVFFLLHFCN